MVSLQETARLAFGNFESLSALNSTFSADYQKNHSKQMSELINSLKIGTTVKVI